MKILDVLRESTHIFESSPHGISIMSPEQFLAKAGDLPEEDLDEANLLGAPAKRFHDQDFQDYLSRIEKQEKSKTDKFKMPYIHRKSLVKYLGPDGKQYDPQLVINALSQRPQKLLKQNEKMQHSNGALEQFYNIGFAALTGIAADEKNNRLVIVNTCPGAGSCKQVCFAMKGGKIQFEAGWLSDGRILTYLINDPEGFKAQLSNEIATKVKNNSKQNIGTTIRWHDSGDFFSPEYLQLAFDIAKAFPQVKFYAYTKMAGAALADKPKNFIINWSEGAHTSQEKQVKAQDPALSQTKNSRIVPTELFTDLLKTKIGKNGKPVLDKEGADAEGNGGRWVMKNAAALKTLKDRIAQQYGLSPASILSYDQWLQKRNARSPLKYNVIVAPGEGDISANSPNVLTTLLLKH